MRNFLRLLPVIALLLALPLLGTGYFFLVEGWGLLDSLYMAVITITTVGFREVHELTPRAQVFVVCYLVLGFGIFTYSALKIGEVLYHANVGKWLARRRMDSAIRTLSNHMIICGFGRMGKTVCQYLAERRIPFVAVDHREEALADCQQEKWPWLVGDATDDDTLRAAGIERAQGLAAILPSDAENVYVVLSARLLSKNLQIIARANEESSVAKLRKAGANRVVGLYDTGAAKMAQLLVNPNLHDFIESFSSRGTTLDMVELIIRPGDAFAGKTLEQTDFRKRGVMILGIRRADGQLLLPPPANIPLEVGDRLIALGSIEAISSLNSPAATQPAANGYATAQ